MTTERELKNLEELADGGDGQACLKLGLIHYEGKKVPQHSENAYKYFRKAEEKGVALAAYYSGLCLYFGQGAIVSDHKAHSMFEKAAEGGCEQAKKALASLPFYEHDLFTRANSGDGEACCKLARSFLDRRSEFKDFWDGCRFEKQWYEVGAAYGDPQATLKLAHVYAEGWHIKWGDVKDEAKSLEYYKKAYESAVQAVEKDGGNAYAKYWLGQCLTHGWGCKKDEEKGNELITQAADGGYPKKSTADEDSPERQMQLAAKCHEEARNAELKVRRGEEPEKNLAVAQEKHKETFYWYKRAVENGYIYACYNLALFYYEGLTVEKDYARAYELLQPIAKCTHGDRLQIWKGASAARIIGDMYSEGLGLKRDEKKAFNWYYSAARRDSMVACTKVGNAYFYGIGTERDYESAAYWYGQAIFDYDEQMFYDSDKGYDYGANVGLGDCYRLGLGVEKDEEEAFRLYDDVSKYTNDCPAADERVARCYYFGIGVERDEEKARDFWKLAAEHGDKDAKAALKKYFPEE